MTKKDNIQVNRLSAGRAPSIIDAVVTDGLTYLGKYALLDLHEQVTRIENARIDGVIIEAGCALGGSAIVMAMAKSHPRPFYIYDVFGMIPPPSDKDGKDIHQRYEEIKKGKSGGIGGRTYYGYEINLFDKVVNNFHSHGVSVEENNVRLVKGLYQDTLYPDAKVALAHIDCDWYESVKLCLERIEPLLSPGGVLVIDDYYLWSGCKRAVNEYFDDKRDNYHFVRKSRLHIVRR